MRTETSLRHLNKAALTGLCLIALTAALFYGPVLLAIFD